MSEDIKPEIEQVVPVVELTPMVIDDSTEEDPPNVEVVQEPPKQDKKEKKQKIDKPPQNVSFDETEMQEIKKLDANPLLTLPPRSEEDMVRIITELPNTPLADSERGQQWSALVEDSTNLASWDGMFDDSLRREGSDWRNGLEYNGAQLRGGYPVYASKPGRKLEGSQAIVRVLNHLGIGSIFNQPMWHSGFWVSFKPATESEIVDLNHLIASDKVMFGRYTYGLAFSNLTSFAVERLLNFAVEHIYETSIRQEDLAETSILSLLRAQDIPAFLTGLMAAMYPRGFNYKRPCCNNPHTCNHIAEATLDLRFLDKCDNSAFTAYQKGHMTNRRRGSMTVESIKRYQSEMASLHPRVHQVKQGYGNDITFKIGSPSALEYVDAGHRWIDAMTDMVNEVIGKEAGSTERDTLLKQHGLATVLCQYSHWVQEISFGDGEIDDRATLDNTLKHLSSDDEVRDKLMEIVKKYINDSTISVIGIRTYDCPKCRTPQTQTSDKPLRSEVIPLDVLQVFMRLVRQRIARLARR